MSSFPPLPDKFDDTDYVRLEDAAPLIGKSEFFNHPELGWVRVLNTVTEIEVDIVVAAYGNPVTGDYDGMYKTWYSETVHLIAPINRTFVREQIRDVPEDVEPADDLVRRLRRGDQDNTL